MTDDYKPLKDRIALVTGGSRGIGAGITRKLASWGATLCVNYVDRSGPAKQIAAELEAQGTKVSLHQADLSEPEAIQSMMDDIQALHGRLNIVVQNAGATAFSRRRAQ